MPQYKRKARIGRPPRYKTVGPVDYHLGLRLDRLRKAQLAVLVALENDRAKRAGKNADVTASSLVSAWIRKRLDAEIRRRGLGRQTKRELVDDSRRPRISKKLLRDLLEAQFASMRESLR